VELLLSPALRKEAGDPGARSARAGRFDRDDDDEEAPAYLRGARPVRSSNAVNNETAGLMDYLSFGASGHMKRLTYWTATFLWAALLIFFMFGALLQVARRGDLPKLEMAGTLSTMQIMPGWFNIFCLIMAVVCFRLSMQRCRDIGWSPWLAVLSWVPLINFFFGLCLLFWPSGTEEAPQGSWMMFLASLLFIVLCGISGGAWLGRGVAKLEPQQQQIMGGTEDQRRLVELAEKLKREGSLPPAEEREFLELMQKEMQRRRR